MEVVRSLTGHLRKLMSTLIMMLLKELKSVILEKDNITFELNNQTNNATPFIDPLVAPPLN